MLHNNGAKVVDSHETTKSLHQILWFWLDYSLCRSIKPKALRQVLKVQVFEGRSQSLSAVMRAPSLFPPLFIRLLYYINTYGERKIYL